MDIRLGFNDWIKGRDQKTKPRTATWGETRKENNRPGEDEQSVVFVVVVEKKKNNENKCPMQSKRLSKTKLGRHL